MKKFLIAGATAMALTPAFAFAQLGNLENILSAIGRLVSAATPIVIGIALLVFFWGLVKFIMAGDDGDSKKRAKHLMLWSVIALFVMVSISGIIGFIGDAVDIDQGGSLPVPTVEN